MIEISFLDFYVVVSIFVSIFLGIPYFTKLFCGEFKRELRYWHILLFIIFPAIVILPILLAVILWVIDNTNKPVFKNKD